MNKQMFFYISLHLVNFFGHVWTIKHSDWLAEILIVLAFCRSHVAQLERWSCLACFPALWCVKKQENQGQFGRYTPVQYLEEGTDSSQDNSFFAWWWQPRPGEDGREGWKWQVCAEGLWLCHDWLPPRLCGGQVRARTMNPIVTLCKQCVNQIRTMCRFFCSLFKQDSNCV